MRQPQLQVSEAPPPPRRLETQLLGLDGARVGGAAARGRRGAVGGGQAQLHRRKQGCGVRAAIFVAAAAADSIAITVTALAAPGTAAAAALLCNAAGQKSVKLIGGARLGVAALRRDAALGGEQGGLCLRVKAHVHEARRDVLVPMSDLAAGRAAHGRRCCHPLALRTLRRS
jgi:hypothetical protein